MTDNSEKTERKAAAMVKAAAELNAQEAGTGRQFFTLRFMRSVAELEAVSQARMYDILTEGLTTEKDDAVRAMMTLNDRVHLLASCNDDLDNENHKLKRMLRDARRKAKKKEKKL